MLVTLSPHQLADPLLTLPSVSLLFLILHHLVAHTSRNDTLHEVAPVHMLESHEPDSMLWYHFERTANNTTENVRIVQIGTVFW